MEKICNKCSCILNDTNRAGKHLQCKPCKSKGSIEHDKKNPEKRRARTNAWVRKIGRVKEYPCLLCNKMCYKKYALAYCSDKCRFMSKVHVTKECWLWTACKNKGYGLTNKNSEPISAHRRSYELFIGPIEDGKLVCHSCDNPSCVRPSHLWLGTTQDNKQDQIKKDRVGVKLKEKDIFRIRELSKEMGPQKIAFLFGVECSTITNILKGRLWKHVPVT